MITLVRNIALQDQRYVSYETNQVCLCCSEYGDVMTMTMVVYYCCKLRKEFGEDWVTINIFRRINSTQFVYIETGIRFSGVSMLIYFLLIFLFCIFFYSRNFVYYLCSSSTSYNFPFYCLVCYMSHTVPYVSWIVTSTISLTN